MEFKIGDRVRHSDGTFGTIMDKMYSDKTGNCYFDIDFGDAGSCLCVADSIEKVDDSQYIHEIEYLDKLVVARLYEVKDGVKVEVARGHGHIFHEGVYGVAQAASYALKRICDNLNGGSLKTKEN